MMPSGVFAVIGDPVSHSLSPRMMMAAFGVLGLPYEYGAIQVPSGHVAREFEALRHAGYRGLNVTVPHKEEARAAVASVDAFGARCGVVNTVRLDDLHGINTDGPGFLDTLVDLVTPGCSVLLLGAGGSARAIALSLALDGYNLRVFNRTPSKAHRLVGELGIDAEVVDEPAPQDVQLIVNATSASLKNEALPIDLSRAIPGAVAYDLVYGETAFLASARAAGLRTFDGKALLVAQGARSLEFWLDVVAPRQAMLEAIS